MERTRRKRIGIINGDRGAPLNITLGSMNAKRPRPNAAQVTYLGSWLIFVSVVLVLEGWTIDALLYLFIGVLAFVGAFTGALWTFRGGKWAYGALGSSLALLAAYALWWTADISHIYSADPDPGLWGAMTAQLENWFYMARAFVGRPYYLYAFSQFYWGVLMALLQLAFLPVLLRSLKSSRGTPQSALVA